MFEKTAKSILIQLINFALVKVAYGGNFSLFAFTLKMTHLMFVKDMICFSYNVFLAVCVHQNFQSGSILYLAKTKISQGLPTGDINKKAGMQPGLIWKLVNRMFCKVFNRNDEKLMNFSDKLPIN